MRYKRQKVLILSSIILLNICLMGCKNESQKTQENVKQEEIVIGFSQLGAESDWRSQNTDSMRDTFTRNKGYKLLIEDGQQQQANQIMAIRKFIQQDVDYIVLAPVTETGWDTVLQEAKDAKIPVIIVDRQVDVADDSLFTCWVGSDFELEGKKAAEWLCQYTKAKDIAPEDIHIANIQGTLGASAQIGRTQGLEEGAKANGWDLLTEVPGEFTQTKGKEAMESLLKDYPQINVVYCENDNEALGAMEAIEKAGKSVGSDIENGDIMLLSFDAVTENIMNLIMADKISFDAGCNPHHGPRVESIIQQLEAGKTPDKFEYIEERIFGYDAVVTAIEVEGTQYPVTIVTTDTLIDMK